MFKKTNKQGHSQSVCGKYLNVSGKANHQSEVEVRRHPFCVSFHDQIQYMTDSGSAVLGVGCHPAGIRLVT